MIYSERRGVPLEDYLAEEFAGSARYYMVDHGEIYYIDRGQPPSIDGLNSIMLSVSNVWGRYQWIEQVQDWFAANHPNSFLMTSNLAYDTTSDRRGFATIWYTDDINAAIIMKMMWS